MSLNFTATSGEQGEGKFYLDVKLVSTQKRPIRTEHGAVVTSEGPGCRGDRRGWGGSVKTTLREITINS